MSARARAPRQRMKDRAGHRRRTVAGPSCATCSEPIMCQLLSRRCWSGCWLGDSTDLERGPRLDAEVSLARDRHQAPRSTLRLATRHRREPPTLARQVPARLGAPTRGGDGTDEDAPDGGPTTRSEDGEHAQVLAEIAGTFKTCRRRTSQQSCGGRAKYPEQSGRRILRRMAHDGTLMAFALMLVLPLGCGGKPDSDPNDGRAGGTGNEQAGGMTMGPVGASGGSVGGASGSAAGGASGTDTGGVSGGSTGGVSGGPTGGAPGTDTGGASGDATGGVSGSSTGGTSGSPGGAPSGGASAGAAGVVVAGAAGQAGGGARGGAGGGGGLDLPGLCSVTFPRPPGCPCTDTNQCDGMCLATGGEECSQARRGICANPPNGGCVCELAAEGPSLLCIELTSCPDTLPDFEQACTPLEPIGPCDYEDFGSPQRCWCMNRFGESQWECGSADLECPYHQPTPDSECSGDIDCFYTTASSWAYRCVCSAGGWQCEQIVG